MEIAFKRLRQQFSDVGYPEDLNGADPAVGFRAMYGIKMTPSACVSRTNIRQLRQASYL